MDNRTPHPQDPFVESFTIEIFQSIALESHQLWREFIEYRSRINWHSVALGFFEPYPNVNQTLHAFYNFCTMKTLKKESCIVAITDLANLVGRKRVSGYQASGFLWNIMLNIPESDTSIPERLSFLSRRPSYLWNDEDNKPRIIIDKVILQSLKKDIKPRIIRNLILHEIGHIVRHRGKLKPATQKKPWNSASPLQETEAWCFAKCIESMALNCLAFQAKIGPIRHQDLPWLYV